MTNGVLRLLLCGFVCGVLWALLGGFLVGILGGEFLATAAQAKAASLKTADRAVLFGLTVLGGVWAMWLYAVVRTSVGPGFKGAAFVGLAWWLMSGLQSAKWMTIGGVPAYNAVALGASVLPAMIAATALGVWLYERDLPRDVTAAPR